MARPTMKGIVIASLALGCVVIGSLGARVEILPPMIGFSVFFVGGVLGAIALVWGVIGILRKKNRGVLTAFVGSVPLLVVAVAAGSMIGEAGPGINDITTDTADAPMFTKSTVHGEYKAEFVAKAAKAYPNVKPLALSISPTAALVLAMDVAESRGWTIVHSHALGFEAYVRSNVFRFRDDILVRVQEAKGGSRLDMRSASRDGKADFGVNAGRIESFLRSVRARAR